jgi:hypothetical protein
MCSWLFTGFGLGSYIFGVVLQLGFGAALTIFAGAQLAAAVHRTAIFSRLRQVFAQTMK